MGKMRCALGVRVGVERRKAGLQGHTHPGACSWVKAGLVAECDDGGTSPQHGRVWFEAHVWSGADRTQPSGFRTHGRQGSNWVDVGAIFLEKVWKEKLFAFDMFVSLRKHLLF